MVCRGKAPAEIIGINKKPKAGRRRKVGARYKKRKRRSEVGKKKKGKNRIIEGMKDRIGLQTRISGLECHFVFQFIATFFVFDKPLVGWLPCPLIAVVQVQTIINGETVAKTMVADVRVPSKVVGFDDFCMLYFDL